VRDIGSRSFTRPLCSALIAGQVIVTIPLTLVARQVSPEKPASAAPKVKVNRTVPSVTPAPARPVFSAEPTDAEIFRARVFEEPLVPIGGPTNPSENRALAAAISVYLDQGGGEQLDALRQFLASHSTSPWRASLLAGMGVVYRRTGRFSRALAAWDEAWALARSSTEPRARAVGDGAVGHLFELNARLGRFDVLERLFTEIEGRDVRGAATEKVSGARQALWLMHNRTEEAFRCGPLAINEILRVGKPGLETPKPIELCKSTKQGTSLTQLRDLAGAVGRRMRLAKRESGAHVYTPAVVHWKVGHFAALVAVDGDRYLVRDPTFGDEMWVRQAAIDDEASGYFLIDQQSLLPGWTPVDDTTGASIWGKGVAAGVDDSDLGGDDPPTCPEGCGGGGGGFGMAMASIHMMLISIRLTDTPVGYDPPVGPAPYFKATYNQRDAFQPQTFSYANLGPKWTFDWLSYLEDDPSNPSAAVTVYHRGAGREANTGYNPSTQIYAPTVRTQAVVTRTSTSPIAYERQLPDGSVETFAQPDGSSTFPRKVFLTALKDPHGNALTFTWDATLRLVAATDALGQVTTLSYDLGADPLKITRVTDPFGRFATFEYDGAGRLQRITDVLGLQSSFTYATNDIVKTLTTPHGTSTFTTLEKGITRWAELTDPLGGKERVQYGFGLTFSDPSALVPTGMSNVNSHLDHHNTLYWDKRAMAVAPGEASSATDYHWALVQSGAYQAAAVPLSIKRPLENRVWYTYQGPESTREGTVRKVKAQGRVLDDGTSQVSRFEYNNRGQKTKETDPLGRETVYVYDATGLDPLQVKQKNGAGYDLLEVRTYNGHHEPLTITDAAGQTTTYTYHANGQVLTVTNAKNETTTYGFNTARYLTSITGPVTSATTTFTYDEYGRLRTTSDADGYTLTSDYDAFDRPTKITYPDTTYEETVYRYLDPLQKRDRLGRWTRFTYDATRRLTSVRDPQGRVVTQEWCTCGSLEALVDANGNRTRWERDVQGRVTKEVRANGSDTDYLYETTTSRLKKVTDAKNQETNHSYFLDGRLQQMTYTNAVIATPPVSFTYDSVYGRMASMVDVIGTTTYNYHGVATPPVLGATELASVDGPLPNDTITYSYDELGRVTSRAINGSANTVTWAFDALGRVTSEANVLGALVYTYDGATSRVATLTYPNGQTSTYSYFGNSVDRRLQTIHHKYPNGTTLSRFDYTYDAVGSILSWRQQADTTAVQWAYGYDAADQLTAAVKTSTDPTPVVLKRFRYAYDPAGNRLAEQVDDAVTGATYNSMNQLVSLQPSGGLWFEGTVNEPATVTIAGKPVTVSETNVFGGTAPVVSGTNTVSLTATDPSGNSRTNTYQVGNTVSSKTLTYDANGNLTSDGTRTFEWDARNQIVAVNVGSHRTEFTYDGRQQRVRAKELEVGVLQTDVVLLWCDDEVCEQRQPDGTTVSKRSFSRGERIGTATQFLTRDHLGSVTDVTDVAATLLARYAYDAWGRRVLVSGVDLSSVGFTGHQQGAAGAMAWFRAFDADTGRWLSEDPYTRYVASVGISAMPDGPNLFAYAQNNPVRHIDAIGLQSARPAPAPQTWPVVTVVIEACAAVGAGSLALLGAIIVMTVGQCGHGCSGAEQEERRKRKGRYHCFAKCHVNNFGNNPNAPPFITGEGWGNSIPMAELASEKDANENLKKLNLRGVTKRHCNFDCTQR
jgi:RHS repeat-associated protein